ncbi:MAG: metallophosphoesterase [Thermodesulfobacteriota bacterium]
MRIIAFGDIHMQAGGWQRIPGIHTADLVVITGDITNFGGRREAAAILDRLAADNPRILAVFGNLDRPEVADLLAERDMDLHGRGRRCGAVGLIGLGGSNPTPFATPSEFSESAIGTLLQRGFDELGGHFPFVLVSHPPPHGTATDRLNDGIHVGSTAVRAFIESRRPAVCLTGHIHESVAEDLLAGCAVINPGMLQQGGWTELTVSGRQINARLHQS